MKLIETLIEIVVPIMITGAFVVITCLIIIELLHIFF